MPNLQSTIHNQPSKIPPRPRRAPLGNLNTLKHGFYSKTFKKIETDDVQECMDEGGLEDEIEMIRIISRRFLELAQKANSMEESAVVKNTDGSSSNRSAERRSCFVSNQG